MAGKFTAMERITILGVAAGVIGTLFAAWDHGWFHNAPVAQPRASVSRSEDRNPTISGRSINANPAVLQDGNGPLPPAQAAKPALPNIGEAGQRGQSANPAAPENSRFSYNDRRFSVVMAGCTAQPLATCTVSVTARTKSAWDYAKDNYLALTGGARVYATSLVVGDAEQSLPAHSAATIDEAVPTSIVFKFGTGVDPMAVRWLVLTIGHWSAKTISLTPNWATAGSHPPA